MKSLAILLVLASPAFADDDQPPEKHEGVKTYDPPPPPPKPAEPAPEPAKPAKSDDDDGVPRLSLPTEEDRVAWTRTGFRLGLGMEYGDFVGLRGAPSGRLLGPFLHVGLRLDRSWSLLSTFVYESASRSGGLSGLHFMGTLDPTWHVTKKLALAVGFGFGGIVEGKTGRMDVSPLPGSLDTSYTFPSSETPLPTCSGVGVAAIARATWTEVIGPRAATTFELTAIGQDTTCVDPTGRVSPDTAQPIVRRQFWSHAGATLSIGVTWR